MNKQNQVAAQYRAVAHMSRAIAVVHEQIEPMIVAGVANELLDMRGARSASIMETLGDILNGMDAVSEDDEWLSDVFSEAHKMFPPKSETRVQLK